MRPGTPFARLATNALAGSVALAALAACATYPAGTAPAGSASLSVRPEFGAFHVANADVAAFGASAVKKLTLSIATVVADDPGTQEDESSETFLTDGQGQALEVVRTSGFGAPVTFDHLAYGKTYRIHAEATRPKADGSGDEVISVEASSFVDVTVEPTLESQRQTRPLKVTLKDRALSAQLLSQAPVTATVASTTRQAPVVAYNPDADQYLVVWVENAAQPDVMAQRVNADGSPAGAPFTIAATTGAETQPSVAYSPEERCFAVAYRQLPSGGGQSVRGQIVRGVHQDGTSELSSPGVTLAVAGPLLSAVSTPTVSIRSNHGGGSSFLYMWQAADLLLVQSLEGGFVSSSGGTSAAFTPALPTLGDPSVPELAYDAGADRFMLAYQVGGIVQPGIFAQPLDLSGNVVGTGVQVASGLSATAPAIAVNPSARKALVAWQDTYTVLARLVSDSATPTAGATITVSDGDAATQPAVAYNAKSDEFLVVWHAMGGGEAIRARRFTAAGDAIGASFTLASGVSANAGPAVAYNGTANEAYTVYQRPGTPAADLSGQRLDFFALP